MARHKSHMADGGMTHCAHGGDGFHHSKHSIDYHRGGKTLKMADGGVVPGGVPMAPPAAPPAAPMAAPMTPRPMPMVPTPAMPPPGQMRQPGMKSGGKPRHKR